MKNVSIICCIAGGKENQAPAKVPAKKVQEKCPESTPTGRKRTGGARKKVAEVASAFTPRVLRNRNRKTEREPRQ